MAQRIVKGDKVQLLAGKDRGRQGIVLKVTAKGALVEGINLITKAVKPDPNKGVEGGLIKREAMVAISNVAVVNPNTNKPDRIGFNKSEDGTKQRYCKSDNSVLSDNR
jgi:large subunit ribosomal protein L24